MPESRKLIFILGAHRSGTSLCAAALQSLGADLCLPSQYANEENRKGFFEHPDVVDFNDRLLAHLGGVWDNPLFIGAPALASADLTPWRQEAVELLQGLYASASVVAIKDPRLCQLLDFWLVVAQESGLDAGDVYQVHVLRNPVEVAVSQRQRALATPTFYELGSEPLEGAALWLSLTCQSLSGEFHGERTHFVQYQDFFEQPQAQLRALAEFVGLTPEPAALEEFATRFVDASLHRSTVDQAVSGQLRSEFPAVLEIYELLQQSLAAGVLDGDRLAAVLAVFERADTQQALFRVVSPALSRLSQRSRRDSLALELSGEELEDLKRQTEEYESVITPLREQQAQLEQGIVELRQQRDAETADKARVIKEYKAELDELGAALGAAEQTIEGMENSQSWRVTRPLRIMNYWRVERMRWLRQTLATFHMRSVYSYNRLSVRYPRFAWFTRRALRPFFALLKRFLAGQDRERLRQYDSGLLLPMIYQQWPEPADYRPLVSVIVPNYNHARFLRLRLDSIYSQSYRNIEVILLDDASSDDSAEILREYYNKHPDNTRLVVNEQNSGGVFHQWEKGLEMARGEIVWIAESDDWCTDNMLDTLVPFFGNEAVQLAYTRTVFMDGGGTEERWTINEYLHDIDPDQWSSANIQTAHNAVAHAFAYKNVIPNVSSAVFRNPGRLELLDDPVWRQMRICGDWIFYLHLLRGGLLAYSPDACNYYRMHGKNTSVTSYSEDKYYQEHEQVAKTVLALYDVAPQVFKVQRDNLIAHWQATRPTYSEEAFDACYSLERIEAVRGQRAPNLLMVSYGFCAGGGETFPVELANLMKEAGYNVTYLDCGREPRNEGVRGRLRADIPVVSDFTQLERIVTDFGIEVAHSHHAWVDSTILEVLPEDTPCKTVVTLHGMYETIHDYDLRDILPRLVRRSACLIYVARKNLEALSRHKLLEAANVVHIENALSAGEFPLLTRADIGLPEDAFVLSLVSRAMEEKGWREAIEIVTRARANSERDIHLLLVGDGLEYDRLATETLPEFIHLMGYQQNVRGYFGVADAGFLPSRFLGESAPLVIIECLQAGRPFLASRLGEIPAMLDGEQGLAGALVDLDKVSIDIDAWATLVAQLASDSASLQELVSRVPSAATKFDPALMVARHDEVYRAAFAQNLVAGKSLGE